MCSEGADSLTLLAAHFLETPPLKEGLIIDAPICTASAAEPGWPCGRTTHMRALWPCPASDCSPPPRGKSCCAKLARLRARRCSGQKTQIAPTKASRNREGTQSRALAYESAAVRVRMTTKRRLVCSHQLAQSTLTQPHIAVMWSRQMGPVGVLSFLRSCFYRLSACSPAPGH